MSTITISTLDSMLEPNRDFAARESAAGKLMPSLPRALPNVKAIIIGCADACRSGSCTWNQTWRGRRNA